MKQSKLQMMQKTSDPEGYRKKSTSSSTGDPRRKQQNRLCLKAKGQLSRLTRSKPRHLIWALLRNKHGNGLEVSRTCCRVWRQVAVLEQGADSLVWCLCDKPFLLHTSQPAPPAKLAHLDTCIHLSALNESMQRCSSSILIKRGCGCSSRRSVRRVCVVWPRCLKDEVLLKVPVTSATV